MVWGGNHLWVFIECEPTQRWRCQEVTNFEYRRNSKKHCGTWSLCNGRNLHWAKLWRFTAQLLVQGLLGEMWRFTTQSLVQGQDYGVSATLAIDRTMSAWKRYCRKLRQSSGTTCFSYCPRICLREQSGAALWELWNSLLSSICIIHMCVWTHIGNTHTHSPEDRGLADTVGQPNFQKLLRSTSKCNETWEDIIQEMTVTGLHELCM